MTYTNLGIFRPQRARLAQPLAVRVLHKGRHYVRPTRDPKRWMLSVWREFISGLRDGWIVVQDAM